MKLCGFTVINHSPVAEIKYIILRTSRGCDLFWLTVSIPWLADCKGRVRVTERPVEEKLLNLYHPGSREKLAAGEENSVILTGNTT